MAKPQRKSINDALAEIAAQQVQVTTAHVGSDHVAHDDAHRPAPVRVDIPRESAPMGALISVVRDHVATPTHHLSADTDEDGYRIRIRREKPHASLYAHPRVFAVIRDLANAQRRKPHDLYVEGLRLMLAQYGYDFDELDGRAHG